MGDYDLYSGSPPHQSHSDTSKASAEQVREKAPVVRAKVFEFIRSKGKMGATDDEIHGHFRIDKNTTAPRRRELQLQGRVMDSGFRRRTTAGKMATVWVVCDIPGFEPGPNVSTKQMLKDALARIEFLEKENAAILRRFGVGQLELISD